MREDVVRMTKRELERWQVIQRVLRGELTQVLAGEALGLSERQVRRMVKKVRRRGARALAHASRGRESPRKMPEAMEERIAEIIHSRYPDFSPLHAAEKLSERHRIEVSREKVRQVMMAKGLWKRRRYRKAVHVWRERKHHLGELVQMDGSHHDWLEGRGPWMVLMGYVDDATGRFYGRFYDHEGVYPAMGQPQALYRALRASPGPIPG
jgi:transposase